MKLLSPMLCDLRPSARPLEEALRYCDENEEALRELQFENETLLKTVLGAVELSGCKLSGCRFPECSFEKTAFTDVIFENCDLSNCTLDGCVFHRVQFTNCKLVGCSFEDAYLRNVKLAHCSCVYLALHHSDAKAVMLEACDLSEADFFDSKFSAAFSGCKLTEARFYLLPLHGVDLTTCDISGVTVSPDDLKGAIVTREQAADLASLFGLVVK